MAATWAAVAEPITASERIPPETAAMNFNR
jgi:hypothetical protein